MPGDVPTTRRTKSGSMQSVGNNMPRGQIKIPKVITTRKNDLYFTYVLEVSTVLTGPKLSRYMPEITRLPGNGIRWRSGILRFEK